MWRSSAPGQLVAASLAAIAIAICGPVAAQSPAVEDAAGIARLARALESEEPEARRETIERLRSLPERALPAIRERLAELRRARPVPEDAIAILHELRRATGSRRADDLIDIADGVELVLAERRDRDLRRMAEPLLLMRSLERIGTTEALSLIPEVLRLDPRAWEMEGRRATIRLGDRVAAAVIRSRGHEDPAGRNWARWSSVELALEIPGRLVQRLSPRDLADVLLAWGESRTMDAMPVVASYVDDARVQVRLASRRSLRAYGQNAIWQSREQFRLRLGESADESWGWERTLDELCRRLDEQRLALVSDLDARAAAALGQGDLVGAEEALDLLLARAPGAASPAIAERFAALGEQLLESEERARARAAFNRALRLAPLDPRRQEWAARLTFIEAEENLAAGVLDLGAFRRAAGAPGCARCQTVLASLEQQAIEPAPRGEQESPRLALMGAAILLALVGLGLVSWRPASSGDHAGEPIEPDPAQDTLSDAA